MSNVLEFKMDVDVKKCFLLIFGDNIQIAGILAQIAANFDDNTTCEEAKLGKKTIKKHDGQAFTVLQPQEKEGLWRSLYAWGIVCIRKKYKSYIKAVTKNIKEGKAEAIWDYILIPKDFCYDPSSKKLNSILKEGGEILYYEV